jgi:hypothetical protein
MKAQLNFMGIEQKNEIDTWWISRYENSGSMISVRKIYVVLNKKVPSFIMRASLLNQNQGLEISRERTYTDKNVFDDPY